MDGLSSGLVSVVQGDGEAAIAALERANKAARTASQIGEDGHV